MVQAARNGVQNIAEGSQASGTSKKTELKLTNVARASLEELLLDYEDYLRQRGLPLWPKDAPRKKSLVAAAAPPPTKSPRGSASNTTVRPSSPSTPNSPPTPRSSSSASPAPYSTANSLPWPPPSPKKAASQSVSTASAHSGENNSEHDRERRARATQRRRPSSVSTFNDTLAKRAAHNEMD